MLWMPDVINFILDVGWSVKYKATIKALNLDRYDMLPLGINFRAC